MGQTAANQTFQLDELLLENVTLAQSGQDPILQSVDFILPTDQNIVVESSNPQNAVLFLQFIACRRAADAGLLLWNNQNIFSDESEFDVNKGISSYFENYNIHPKDTIKSLWLGHLSKTEYTEVCRHFELQKWQNKSLKELPFALQKIAFLVKTLFANPQMLILEDPANGLTDQLWLNFLDFVQYKQRQGHLRHIYLTNHHPTALSHLTYNKIYIEDGLIYFDQEAGFKKVSHF